MALTLLSNATTNGDGPIITSVYLDAHNRAAPLTLYISGSFAGATITLYASPDGSLWLPVPNAVFTTAQIANLDIGAMQIKAVVTGAASGTSLSVVAL